MLKISTSDKKKAKHWDLLIEDKEMETKMTDRGKYDLTKFTWKNI